GGPFGRFFYGFVKLARGLIVLLGKRNMALNIGVAFSMPYRALARMTGGAFNMEMLEALLVMVNGRFFAGLGQLLRANSRKKQARKFREDGI
ncbi:MAG TPA: glycosyl hydrolase, partial [Clostridia bacterium]|nr:glycosyl hydrolase [Clostridia bacterium]